MSKLALVALVLGACVADAPPESSRTNVTGDFSIQNNSIEIPTTTGAVTGFGSVEITGYQKHVGSILDTTVNTNQVTNTGAQLAIGFKELCAVSGGNPVNDACGLLCDLNAFAERVASGSTECQQVSCPLDASTTVQIQVCP